MGHNLVNTTYYSSVLEKIMLSPDSHLGANISVIRHRACQIQYENFYLLFNWIGQWSKNKEYAEFGRSSLDMYFNPF